MPDRVAARGEPLFLERRTYRRRRLMDAARLLPALGAFLFALPALFAEGEPGARTASGGLYVFAVWTGLIVSAMLISPRLARSEAPETEARSDAPLSDARTDMPLPDAPLTEARTDAPLGDPGPRDGL